MRAASTSLSSAVSPQRPPARCARRSGSPGAVRALSVRQLDAANQPAPRSNLLRLARLAPVRFSTRTLQGSRSTPPGRANRSGCRSRRGLASNPPAATLPGFGVAPSTRSSFANPGHGSVIRAARFLAFAGEPGADGYEHRRRAIAGKLRGMAAPLVEVSTNERAFVGERKRTEIREPFVPCRRAEQVLLDVRNVEARERELSVRELIGDAAQRGWLSEVAHDEQDAIP